MDRDRLEDFVLAGPGIILLALAFVFPIFTMLRLSIVDESGAFTLGYFIHFLSDSYYLGVVWRTAYLSIIITMMCAIIGFPLAFIMARIGPRARVWLIILIILPLMTSVVVRTFGWMVVMGRGGFIPYWLNQLGLVNRNFSLMHTEAAIVIGLVQVLIPFTTLSILSVLMKIDPRLEEAARTMGASFLKTVGTVTIPLAMPGIVAGCILAFTLSVSSFVTPTLLGGMRLPVVAGLIFEATTKTLEWNFAAAQSVILLGGVLLALVPYIKLTSRRNG